MRYKVVIAIYPWSFTMKKLIAVFFVALALSSASVVVVDHSAASCPRSNPRC